LNEYLVLLSKRRGLLKESIKQMIQRAQAILTEGELSYDTKMDLIDTILKVAEGKIYVEKPRARVVRLLAQIREDEGKIDEAAKILQEVQVETFGTMKKNRKNRISFRTNEIIFKEKRLY